MRKKTTRREAMTVGLGAVVLGTAGEAAGAEAGNIQVGHHYKHKDEATFHIIGTGTDWKQDKVIVELKGTTADPEKKPVTWHHNPSKQEVVSPTLIKVKLTPTWDTREEKGDPGDKRGLGSLTVIVTNDDGTNMLTITLANVTYIT